MGYCPNPRLWTMDYGHVEIISVWNQWDTQERAAQLSMNLTGVARQAWTDSFCDSAAPVTYDALVSVLTQRFKPKGQEEAYKAEFRHRIRKKEESFMEFGHTLRRLAIRAFPNIAHEAREDLIVDQFLQGLPDADMRRHVSLAHPSSVDEAISMATEYETVSQSLKPCTGSKPKPVAMVKDAGGSKETNDLLRNLIDAMHKKETQQPKRRNNNITCFKCQEPGHIARDCPKKRTEKCDRGSQVSQSSQEPASQATQTAQTGTDKQLNK